MVEERPLERNKERNQEGDACIHIHFPRRGLLRPQDQQRNERPPCQHGKGKGRKTKAQQHTCRRGEHIPAKAERLRVG